MKLLNPLNIEVENFILDKRTLPKKNEKYLDVLFTNEKATTFDVLTLDYPFSATTVKSLKINHATVLEKDDDREIIELKLKNDFSIDILPGDTLMILPVNNTDEIDILLQAMKISKEEAESICEINIKPETTKKLSKIPNYLKNLKVSCLQILTNILNIKSIPKKALIRSLLEYCDCSKEREFLESLCCREGSDLYNDFIENKKFTFLDILQICKTVHPPFNLLLEHLPRLLPRPYSISNFKNIENEIKIIFSHPLKKPGITTTYLKNKIEENEKDLNSISAYIKNQNKFRFNEEYYSKNIVMISVGCGISPFLGFLEQKEFLLKKGYQIDKELYLYCGFKYKNTPYHDDLIKYEQNGLIDKIYECFSRDSDADFKYVQDAITFSETKLCSLLLDDNTLIFVCADGGKISNSIKNCIKKCLFDHHETDEGIIQEWIKIGKYIEDI